MSQSNAVPQGRAAEMWDRFHIERSEGTFPRWPNELMLRVLFGDFLETRPTLPQDAAVLDVGCGFGQNLLPFLARGCRGFGVEITEQIAAVTRTSLAERGLDVEVKVGTNRSLPYADQSFDLVLSIDTVHYESSAEHAEAALAEFQRVLKPGGWLFMTTCGPHHDMSERGEIVGPHLYRIRDYDMRNGEVMYFFDSEKYLEHALRKSFGHAETGRASQLFRKQRLDWLVGAARKV